jgi:hypothetical protein
MNNLNIYISNFSLIFILIFIPSKVNADSSRILEKLLDEKVSLWTFSQFRAEIALKSIVDDINGKDHLYDYGFPSDAMLNNTVAVIYDTEQNRFIFHFVMYGKSRMLSKRGNYVNQETCNSVLSLIQNFLGYANLGDQGSPSATNKGLVLRFESLFGFNNGLEVAQKTILRLQTNGTGSKLTCSMPALKS